MSRPVFAFRYPKGEDPHEVVIEISDDDTRAWQDAEDRAHITARTAYGPWVRVTDEKTGREVDLRSAPCGAGCRCAAEIKELA